jgi:hypothetical protein
LSKCAGQKVIEKSNKKPHRMPIASAERCAFAAAGQDYTNLTEPA